MLQKIAYSKSDSDLIAKQKGTYKERGTKRKEEEKKKKKGKDTKGAPTVPVAGVVSGECVVFTKGVLIPIHTSVPYHH